MIPDSFFKLFYTSALRLVNSFVWLSVITHVTEITQESKTSVTNMTESQDSWIITALEKPSATCTTVQEKFSSPLQGVSAK